ncbi:Tryptophan synthase beta subunit-like PLP-dependent enzyme [Vigna unguiculata]|uniref:Tryptophan synthase beta subunit-like PLP-dependent enzyme n=1 Tax=Vigna unguiculata TaxID=3917 RepID=A0A4D6KRQ3_VIGUN|nr:Tryptophan synthase beta subunit-like PLP-dependent enzyme [Vigna unguiculata]
MVASLFGSLAHVTCKIHYETMNPKICRDSKEKIDALVVGIGTRGSIIGAGKFLK